LRLCVKHGLTLYDSEKKEVNFGQPIRPLRLLRVSDLKIDFHVWW